ncbi:MAG: SufD family Fe-S cluster assembly protein [Lachnospiraceae bacterium]|nr:SufD family Fe-S cluster assembly protein [Lachnospiraceae bacterium]
MVINKIPSPTWNWLHMNDGAAEGFEILNESEVDIHIPEGVDIENGPLALEEIKTGSGDETDAFIREMSLSCDRITVPANTEFTEPIRMSFSYEKDVSDANIYAVEVKENASLTLIMNFTSQAQAKGNVLSQLKYRCQKGASLTVVQTQMISDEISFINDIGGECEEDAQFHLIQVVFGGKQTYLGSRTELLGKRSASTADLGYLLTGSEALDVNYIVNHIGKKTNCDILVNGVLKDAAKKVFRGTIDFKKGAAGSVGSELEDVLLMGEDITNQTLPVILCAEEDVEGNHGATIGELDEDLMFYLMSRGSTREEIYNMMSRARIEVIAKKIADEETRQMIFDHMDEK